MPAGSWVYINIINKINKIKIPQLLVSGTAVKRILLIIPSKTIFLIFTLIRTKSYWNPVKKRIIHFTMYIMEELTVLFSYILNLKIVYFFLFCKGFASQLLILNKKNKTKYFFLVFFNNWKIINWYISELGWFLFLTNKMNNF